MQGMVFDHAFWIALIQIVGIDIVLSGDNAVVIALAARGLNPVDRKRAVMWGSTAAVAMRVTLTIVAAELLRLPLLKAAGALLLLWIAVQLLVPEDESDGEGGAVVSGMAAAIKTIMLADLVMSMDNVVAIAGASKGNLALLIFGLGLSIPLVVFSSTFLMKVMERFPVVITGGAALLGFVAGEMAVSDLWFGPWITPMPRGCTAYCRWPVRCLWCWLASCWPPGLTPARRVVSRSSWISARPAEGRKSHDQDSVSR